MRDYFARCTTGGISFRYEGIVLVGVFCVFITVVPLVLTIYNADFNVYHNAGRSVWQTGTLDYWQSSFLDDADGAYNEVNRFHNLPLVALLFVPLAGLGYQTAGNFFIALELVAYLTAFIVSLRFFSSTHLDGWILLFLFLFCRFFYTSLQLGQITILVLLLIVFVMVSHQKQKPYITGILVSCASILKLPLGILLFYFACKNEYKVLAVSALSTATILLVSIAVFGIQLHADYIKDVILSSAGSTLLAYNNPGITALIMRLLTPEGPFDWSLVRVPVYVSMPVLAASLGLLIFLYKTLASRRTDSPLGGRLEISIVVCASLLVFPIVWDHYYLFLLLPYYFAIQGIRLAEDDGWKLYLPMWATSLALISLPVLPLIQFMSRVLSLEAANILMPSAPLWGCLTLLALLILLYRRHSQAEKSVEGFTAKILQTHSHV